MLRTLRSFVLLGTILPIVAGNQPSLFLVATEVSGFRHAPFFLSPFFDIDAFYKLLGDHARVHPPRYIVIALTKY